MSPSIRGLGTQETRAPETVLIFRTGQLGDTLVALPAISLVRKRHPVDRIVLLTDRHLGSGFVSSWDVLGPSGLVDDVEYYEPGGGSSAMLSNAVALSRRLRRLAPAEVYVLSPYRNFLQCVRDRMFFRLVLLGVRQHFPVPTSWYGRWPWGRAQGVSPEWMRLMSAVEIDEKGIRDFSLPTSPAAELEAERRFEKMGLRRERRWLAVAPGSKMPAKIWPAERYAEIGRMLIQKYPDLDLVVLGGNEDTAVGDQLCASWGERGFNLAGKLSVQASAVVLRRCAGYLGNDSGTMHLAAASGVRCVALFSARDRPGKWDPFGSGHVVVRKDVDCAGCMLETCTSKGMKCLALIQVDEVFRHVSNLLR